MAGNILGGRSYYLYTDDNDDNYSVLMDDSLAAAQSATLNDSNVGYPRRFKPRGIYLEALIGGVVKRKFLVITDPTSDLYASNVTQTVTIDGVAYQSTGRRGEELSFARNAGATDPGDADGTD